MGEGDRRCPWGGKPSPRQPWLEWEVVSWAHGHDGFCTSSELTVALLLRDLVHFGPRQ